MVMTINCRTTLRPVCFDDQILTESFALVSKSDVSGLCIGMLKIKLVPALFCYRVEHCNLICVRRVLWLVGILARKTITNLRRGQSTIFDFCRCTGRRQDYKRQYTDKKESKLSILVLFQRTVKPNSTNTQNIHRSAVELSRKICRFQMKKKEIKKNSKQRRLLEMNSRLAVFGKGLYSFLVAVFWILVWIFLFII